MLRGAEHRAGARVWEHLRMESQDDPEARIRDLERPLSDRARMSELGMQPPGPDLDPTPTRPYAADPYPPPPPMTGPLPPMPPPAGYGPPYPGWVPGNQKGPPKKGMWIAVAATVAVGAAASIAIAVWFAGTMTDSGSTVESIDRNPSVSIDIPPAGPGVTVPDAPPSQQLPVGPGDVLSVAGVGNTRTIVCDGGTITVSGVDNVINLSGQCGGVAVSGVRNEVHLESAGTIGVSGFDNTITYRVGTPEISQSGDGNSIRRD